MKVQTRTSLNHPKNGERWPLGCCNRWAASLTCDNSSLAHREVDLEAVYGETKENKLFVADFDGHLSLTYLHMTLLGTLVPLLSESTSSRIQCQVGHTGNQQPELSLHQDIKISKPYIKTLPPALVPNSLQRTCELQKPSMHCNSIWLLWVALYVCLLCLLTEELWLCRLSRVHRSWMMEASSASKASVINETRLIFPLINHILPQQYSDWVLLNPVNW